MRADEGGEIVANVDFLGEGSRESTGRMSNFRRGVTRYPIPGCEVHRGHHRGPARRCSPPSDEPHIEIGTVYPTDDIRGALYVDPMLSQAFRGAGIDRYRQIDLGRADPAPDFASFRPRVTS